jgi:hypothetical protein
MKRRTRYLFIVFGFIFFAIAAPLIVFFVGGIHYDHDSNRYEKTGIISVVSEPKKATVYLDGKEVDTTPASLRFLTEGEYTVTLKKDGYFDWSKRLQVKAGKATIASDALDKIYLMKRDSAPRSVAQNAVDYDLAGNRLVVLGTDHVTVLDTKDLSTIQTIPLPNSAGPAGVYHTLLAAPEHDYFLVSGSGQTVWLDLKTGTVISLTGLAARADSLLPQDDGSVLALRGKVLVRISPTGRTTTPLVDHVGSFTVLGDTLYYLRQQQDTAQLLAASVRTVQSDPGVVIADTIPLSLSADRLFVTSQKDVLLFSGSTLYKINAQPDVLADNIKELYVDPTTATVLFVTPSELSWYESGTNKTHLITRTAQAVSNPRLDTGIGYGFYVQGATLHAMELDTTDRQNDYILGTGQSLSRVNYDKNKGLLYYLDGTDLKSIAIK